MVCCLKNKSPEIRQDAISQFNYNTLQYKSKQRKMAGKKFLFRNIFARPHLLLFRLIYFRNQSEVLLIVRKVRILIIRILEVRIIRCSVRQMRHSSVISDIPRAAEGKNGNEHDRKENKSRGKSAAAAECIYRKLSAHQNI